jgi:threonyl-tRNA synthetase
MVLSMGQVSRRANVIRYLLTTITSEIDITITDALKRRWQCATIQLDFNLPIQFKLSYRTGGGEAAENKEADQDRARPVMIHRAILGSVERFTAIITEHFGGKW